MTTPTDGGRDELHRQAEEFAASLTATLGRVLDDVPPFTVLIRSGDAQDRLHVSPRRAGNPVEIATIPLVIARRHRLNLRIEMFCTWDRPRQFLTITWSKVAVETLGEGTRAQPLFRFEYDREHQADLPCAHLHIHAHRDETTWMMTLGRRGRAKQRAAKETMPVLAELHFPLGGHRFRPCVEDVLEMFINEFGVEPRDDQWRVALREGRADWRRKQLGAAVRDSPAQAAAALERRGWTVTPPAAGDVSEDLDRLTSL